MKLAVLVLKGPDPALKTLYLLHPFPIETEVPLFMFEQMGYIILEVDTTTGRRLCQEGQMTHRHLTEVMALTKEKLHRQRKET